MNTTSDVSFTVLIVEDNPTVMRMLAANFEKKGDTVIESLDGADLIERIKNTQPDIILLDVMLPIKDGFTHLAEMRAAKIDIPVLMLTEKREVDDKVHGLETGADDYITKPFSFRELYARIRSNLRRKGGITKQVIVDQLRIDRLARTALFDSKPIDQLTKTEFDLLLYLAENSPRVVPHGELLENVLGYNAEAETKALVMHIANLRRKLKKNGLENSILVSSVPAVGYRLEVK
ncbi:response regulator transcription factor [Desulfopila sp. IMCC35008]|uniref:response regulator transcription factor n=1 Tax=Desulfopila sp. IMCC35008 TaxID=2653858 RepID=UPI0013D856CF|nr:response regulator transcription factor [Desulfopila sp. IMCC35008]